MPQPPVPPNVTSSEAPANRGRLMYADEIAREIFRGRKSAWWVRRNVAPRHKKRLGHSTVVWYEEDVWAWIDAQGREGDGSFAAA